MSLAEWVEALTEILQIIAWPAIVAWLVWYLRDEVKRAAARIIELGLTGAKFAPPSPPEQVASPPGRALQLPGSHPATPQEGSSRVQQYVASIRAFISDDQLDFAAQRVRADVNQVGSNPTDQVEALIYTVALLNIQIAHERNYNAIYGSQLRLLAQMTSAVGASPAVARQVFEEAKAAYPDAYRSDTFERWTGFLLASGLCTITQDGNYVLTPFGRGFLKYIVDRRLPTDKPF